MLESLKSALTLRVAQFALRLAAMIASAVGWQGFDQGAQGKAFAAAVVAVVAFLVDALIHSKKFAPLIDKGKEFLLLTGEATPASTGPTKPEATSIDSNWVVILLLGAGLAIAAATAVPGCSSSPSPQVQAAQRSEAFRVGLHALNAAISEGKVSKAQARKLAPYVLAANALLDQAQAQANTVATLEAQLKVAPDDAARAQIQAQLDVARDAYSNLLRSLDAALTAFQAAKDNPDAIPDGPATVPTGGSRGVARASAALALAGGRSGGPLHRAA